MTHDGSNRRRPARKTSRKAPDFPNFVPSKSRKPVATRRSPTELRLGALPVDALAKLSGKSAAFKLFELLNRNLAEVLGSELARMVRLHAIDETTITFATDDPILAHEVELNSQRILKNLKSAGIRSKVRKIRCRVRAARESTSGPASFTLEAHADEIPPDEADEPVELDRDRIPPESRQLLDRALAEVEDPDLRAMLERVLIGSRLRYPETGDPDADS